MKTNRRVTLGGKSLALEGNELKVGDPAPDFAVIGNDLKPLQLSSFRGKSIIVSAVPSLDTPVCDLETRRFNQEAAKLGPNVVILTISMDLPFAQKRWCAAAGIDKVITASDHQTASFGKAYGVLIPEPRLLARAVFVVDGQGIIRHVQLLEDVGKEPNYEKVLEAVKRIQ